MASKNLRFSNGPIPRHCEERSDEGCPQQPLLSSPGIAVRRTASLPLAYDRAIQYAAASRFTTSAAGYWITRFRG
jgi:hypothetical protein